MTTLLYEKIAKLPPALLPRVERLVDALTMEEDSWDDLDCWDDLYDEPDWGPPPVDENGKPIHPQPGCMKDVIVMKDNYFEPDDIWEDYM